MAIRFISHLSTILALHRTAAQKAVNAAARVVMREAKGNVRGGFKTGQFVTGEALRSVSWGELPRGIRAGVGGGRAPDMLHPMFWELGHQSIYTGQFERNTWLSSAFKSTADKQQEAAAQAARKEMKRSPLWMNVRLKSSMFGRMTDPGGRGPRTLRRLG